MTGRVCWGEGEGTPAQAPGQEELGLLEKWKKASELWDRGEGTIREVSRPAGARRACTWGSTRHSRERRADGAI